ncbi:septum formation initiator family protein [Patescibacteria group bacterium]|nr:septum formation initiator family protein [Patescibacteria group bacterium]
MSRLKKSGFLGKLMFLVGLLLLWSLMKGFFELRGAYKRVDEAKEVLEIEETKYEELKEKLEEVQEEEYIERVIRNELNMQKEGETVVVLQDGELSKIPDQVRDDVEKKENWEKWLDLWR